MREAVFNPTPENSKIDGHKWGKFIGWDEMDWGNKIWRDKSSMMVAIVGKDAPYDPHWSVPKKDGETRHRVRSRKKYEVQP